METASFFFFYTVVDAKAREPPTRPRPNAGDGEREEIMNDATRRVQSSVTEDEEETQRSGSGGGGGQTSDSCDELPEGNFKMATVGRINNGSAISFQWQERVDQRPGFTSRAGDVKAAKTAHRVEVNRKTDGRATTWEMSRGLFNWRTGGD